MFREFPLLKVDRGYCGSRNNRTRNRRCHWKDLKLESCIEVVHGYLTLERRSNFSCKRAREGRKDARNCNISSMISRSSFFTAGMSAFADGGERASRCWSKLVG